jgi:hypothetical protein
MGARICKSSGWWGQFSLLIPSLFNFLSFQFIKQELFIPLTPSLRLTNMSSQKTNPEDYQKIFHWAETQKDGSVPSFATRKNDPYKVLETIDTIGIFTNYQLQVPSWVWKPVSHRFHVHARMSDSFQFRIRSYPRDYTTGTE